MRKKSKFSKERKTEPKKNQGTGAKAKMEVKRKTEKKGAD